MPTLHPALRLSILAAALMLGATPAAAAWRGEAGAGLLTTSGNSESESVNGKFQLDWTHEVWKNSFTGTAINSGDEEGRTAERYTLGNKLDWNFTPNDYLFGAVDWEKDLFGGFRERTAETAGYGRHILRGPVHVLDAEIGAGARQTEEQDTGDRENELIGRFGGKYEWKISETSAFSQKLKVEHGRENTFSEALSELKLSIIGNLFASISFTARNNSEVPPDTKKTDTFTAVNLSYAFGTR
jgi:putative salt-induced outer membrane protein